MTKYIALTIFVACIGILPVYFANERTNSLELKAQCIELVAKEQGYKGNPASREAWDLFANQCN